MGKKRKKQETRADKEQYLSLDQIGDILERIRALGSLLISASLGSWEHDDWTAVLIGGRMIMDDAQLVLDEFDRVSATAEVSHAKQT